MCWLCWLIKGPTSIIYDLLVFVSCVSAQIFTKFEYNTFYLYLKLISGII